jgi:hypothetical protein
MCKERANTSKQKVKDCGRINWVFWDGAQIMNVNLSAFGKIIKSLG